MTTLVVPRRFRGPTESANGGYICGIVAALMRGPVTVRLLSPPPLDTPLRVEHRDDGLELLDGETPVVTARAGDIGDLEPPAAPPTYDEAVVASRSYAGHTSWHPAPECFVCGPQRAPGDALCIYCGPVGRNGLVAAPWIPDPSLDCGDGSVGPEIVWAALDCPGFIAAAPEIRSMLLGELTARIDRRVRIGERCVAIGWPLGASGRKHEVGTAVFGEAGDLCGIARAIWIEPRAAE